jgi:uncharacterized membrane protein YdbT with pleckstrin-like domain
MSAQSNEQTTQNTSQQTTHRESTEGIDLLPDEQVLANAHPGWSVWWKHLLVAVLIVLGGLGTGEGSSILGGIVVGGAIVGYVYLSRIQSRYIVTNERVKGKVGLISSKTREYRISDLESISTEMSIMERLLSLGNIKMRTAANDQMRWGGVPNHEQVARQMRERRRAYDQQ